MRLVINMGLSDKVLLYHITPIAAVNKVREIFIIRNTPGPKIQKVQYFYPPAFISHLPIVREIYKLLLTTTIAFIKKPDLFHSFILFPHGFISLLSGIIFRKPTGVSLLNGKAEVFSVGTRDRSLDLDTLPPISILLLKLLKRFTVITTTGSRTRDFLIEHELLPKKVLILSHYISPIQTQKREKKIYDCIYVGRLARIKHVEIMIKALSLVKKNNPDIRAIILGDGICKKSLECLTLRLGLENNISFQGHVTDVNSYLRKSRMLVSCSEREGFPFAILEALHNRIPVITSDCGDITDIVKDGYNSIIINDYKDVTCFATAILHLLSDNILYTRLSLNTIQITNTNCMEKNIKLWKKIGNITTNTCVPS